MLVGDEQQEIVCADKFNQKQRLPYSESGQREKDEHHCAMCPKSTIRYAEYFLAKKRSLRLDFFPPQYYVPK